MKLMTILLATSAAVALGETQTDDAERAARKRDDLRIWMSHSGVPEETPEDALYPLEDNLFKLDEYHRAHGTRPEAKDLPRLERTYRTLGRSDGIFNVPEGISRRTGDEWDGECGGSYQVAKRNEKGEMEPLTKAEVTRNRINNSPYHGPMSIPRFMAPLGQLAKMCDGVFIGTVGKAHYRSPEDEKGVHKDHVVDVTLTFRVETNLFGRVTGGTVSIPMQWHEGKENVPQPGMRILVFYSRGFTIPKNSFPIRESYVFDWQKPPETPKVAPTVIVWENSFSIRIIDSPETEKAYIEAVAGYLRLLRREARDPVKYYEFLRPLVNSPVWRIRQDAREDLMNLLGLPLDPARFDVRRVLDDSSLDWALGKDYVRYIAIPAHEKRFPPSPPR